MGKRAELETLANDLARLVEMLRLDADCQWRGHFEQCLCTAQEYLHSGFTQDDLNSLSASVMRVYGGMGSFNDYAPVIYDWQTGQSTTIPGTETYDRVAVRVYDGALSLRVVRDVT